MRPVFQWNLGARSLELGKRTLIMGIVNVTPDSFSDGGQFLDRDQAIEHAEQLLERGRRHPRHWRRIDAARSARRCRCRQAASRKAARLRTSRRAPPPLAHEEELKRVLPVIAELKKKHPIAQCSPWTPTKQTWPARPWAPEPEIVNDVSGFRWDARMAKTIAELKCGAVLMHMRGRPEEWRTLPPPGDIVLLVKRELKEWAEKAVLAGVRRERIVLDPGFGFGKSFDENYPLLGRFSELQAAGFPLLAGTSRKSFIGRTLGREGKEVPPGGPALRNTRNPDRADSQGRAHSAHARREGRGRRGVCSRCNPGGAVAADRPASLPAERPTSLLPTPLPLPPLPARPGCRNSCAKPASRHGQ